MIPVEELTIRKRRPNVIKIILAVVLMIIIALGAFYAYGAHIYAGALIYPNVTISGTDVSGLERVEALNAINLQDYARRIRNASVTITFPDETEVTVTGSDANLQHDAFNVVSDAFAVGRDDGVIQALLSYIDLQHPEAHSIDFEVSFLLDAELLRTITDTATSAYNERLDASVTQILEDRIIITRGSGHIHADMDEIFTLIYDGLFESFETGTPIEIRYKLPPSNTIVDDILYLRDRIFVEMVNSEFDPETIAGTPCVVGVDFDFIAAAELLSDTELGTTVEFELQFTYPEVTQDALNARLFRDLLGERTTFVHGTNARLNNVGLSAEKINGYIMLPGHEFSFNGVVGRRTAEAGFQAAPAIVSGEMVNVLGGGVCQTSSTLFASIRPTELLVTQQRRHTRPVPYLPWGWDAAIWYPTLDLRFVNNTDYPILLIMVMDERMLTARVYGTIVDDFPIAADWR